MSNAIDIVMVTFNRVKFTRQAVRYLYRRTTTPFRLIVVDNGSTDGTVEYLNWLAGKKPETVAECLPGNYGIHYAKNVGLSHVRSACYVDTDNDILCADLEPDWLTRLMDLMTRHAGYAAIACRPQIFVGGLPGTPFESAGEVKAVPWCGGCLRLMDTAAVHHAGGWRDEIAPGRDNEERWIGGKLAENGYRVGYARDVRCWHLFGTEAAPWGYDGVPLEVHGHRPVEPPVWHYDTPQFRRRFSWQTFEPQ